MKKLDARLERYVSETLRFSRALNLTAVKDAAKFHRRFVEPSLALLPWLPEQGVLLDVGSGMGVPGVPLLLARSGLRGVLVERRKKRAEFLRHLVRTLNLDADVHDCDVRELAGIRADALVARAVAKPEALLTMTAHLMAPDALAVLPTAMHTPPAGLDGWRYEGESRVPLDECVQAVHRYRRTEGFT